MQLQNDAIRKIMVGHYTVSVHPLYPFKFYSAHALTPLLSMDTLHYYSFTRARS